MSIIAGELICYQSANMPEDDATTSGGAINTAGKVDLTDLTANDRVSVQSDGADTRTVTITGRLASGAIDSEALVLNGVTWVDGAKTFERILKVVTTSSGTRTVTVAKYAAAAHTPTLCTIETNFTSVRRLFYDAASEASGTTRYEKIFWKNTNASLTLNTAILKLTADPATKLTTAVALAKDDSVSVANRKTQPAGLTWVDDNVSMAVPGNTLEAASAIGLWLCLTLGASDPAFKNTFTTQLSGTTV